MKVKHQFVLFLHPISYKISDLARKNAANISGRFQYPCTIHHQLDCLKHNTEGYLQLIIVYLDKLKCPTSFQIIRWPAQRRIEIWKNHSELNPSNKNQINQ
jgi:hypothetical protein